ncbi:hypothetical protein DRJ25_03500 [Candidatus Woesearchaeota archaeon]|nr:MAG: hypothetical protein DRJ25_03500 [Candidatus Woesearchaeota archaeon]
MRERRENMKYDETNIRKILIFAGVVIALLVGFFIPSSANDILKQALKIILFISITAVFYFMLFSGSINLINLESAKSNKNSHEATSGIPEQMMKNEAWKGFANAFSTSHDNLMHVIKDSVVAKYAVIYLRSGPDSFQNLVAIIENDIIHEPVNVKQDGVIDLILKKEESSIESNMPIGTTLNGFNEIEIRSLIGIPLVWSGDVVGILVVASDAAENFGEDDKKIIEHCSVVFTNLMTVCLRGKQWEHDQKVYSTLVALEREMLLTEDFESAVSVFVQHTKKLFPFDRFTLCTVDGNMGVIQSVYGKIGMMDKGRRFNLDDGLTGLVIKRKSPVLIGDLKESDYPRPRYSKEEDQNHGMRSYIAVPLGRGENVWGSVVFENSIPYQYEEKSKQVLTLLAGHFTNELERIQLYEQIKELKQGPIIFNEKQTNTE